HQQQRRVVRGAERVVLDGDVVGRCGGHARQSTFRLGRNRQRGGSTMTVFGVHVGLQHTTADELRNVWRRVEELGFGWISVWDHFYGATGKPDDAACLEAVAMHAALACTTTKVRCGALVYSIGY